MSALLYLLTSNVEFVMDLALTIPKLFSSAGQPSCRSPSAPIGDPASTKGPPEAVPRPENSRTVNRRRAMAPSLLARAAERQRAKSTPMAMMIIRTRKMKAGLQRAAPKGWLTKC